MNLLLSIYLLSLASSSCLGMFFWLKPSLRGNPKFMTAFGVSLGAAAVTGFAFGVITGHLTY